MKKRKLIVAVLTFGMLFAFGCGKNKNDGTQTGTTENGILGTDMTEDLTTENKTTENGTTENGTTENDTTGNDTTNDSNENADTIGKKLKDEFMTEIKKSQNLHDVAAALAKHESVKAQNMEVVDVNEGYLSGFDADITGFKKGVMFSPVINTIPFVGYIFETDTPETLVKTLKDHAQLNWNICTVADEMVVETSDNYVLFVMSPNSFEQ